MIRLMSCVKIRLRMVDSDGVYTYFYRLFISHPYGSLIQLMPVHMYTPPPVGLPDRIYDQNISEYFQKRRDFHEGN